jgi:recombinational DNA repair protein (RecF pathway)
MRDLVSLLQSIAWRCTRCGARAPDVHVRWGYDGLWCDTCWHEPPEAQAHEWYTLSDVIRLLTGTSDG